MTPELTGEDCSRCGFRTLEATFDGETWYRCVTDSCPRGWYEANSEVARCV